MIVLQFHVLLLITLVAPTLISATTPAQNYPIAKPGCKASCGNISIPFPFGTSQNCYRNSTFRVICNETFNPPKLFLGTSTIEIINISVNTGQLKMMRMVVKSCYDQYGTLTDNSVRWAWMTLNYLYAINNTANKFTVVGCDSYGYIFGRRWRSNQYYSTGCITTCQNESDVEDGTCTGSGCCQVSQFPDDSSRLMNLSTGSFVNHTNVWPFSKCTYGFLAEDGFKFHRENITNLINVKSLPIIVDWVISKETCQSARMNVSNYACQDSNSECVEPNIGKGYRCQCKTGYEGNPYLLEGCTDINECDFPGLHNCGEYDCLNSPGSFTCNCPEGYHGNATREGGCVPVGTPINDSKNGESPIYKSIADVDECVLREHSNCTFKCANTPGSFNCECPKGYLGKGTGESGCFCPKGFHGDGIREGGCIRGEQLIYRPIAGTSLGIILVMVVICLFYMELRRRRSRKMKHMFFLQNGGLLLQEKLTAAAKIMSEYGKSVVQELYGCHFWFN